MGSPSHTSFQLSVLYCRSAWVNSHVITQMCIGAYATHISRCVSLHETGTLNNTTPTAIQEPDPSSKNPQTHKVTSHNRRHDAKAEEQFKHHETKKKVVTQLTPWFWVTGDPHSSGPGSVSNACCCKNCCSICRSNWPPAPEQSKLIKA